MKKIKKIIKSSYYYTKDKVKTDNFGIKKKILWIGSSHLQNDIKDKLTNRWSFVTMDFNTKNNTNNEIIFSINDNSDNKIIINNISDSNSTDLIDKLKSNNIRFDCIFIQNINIFEENNITKELSNNYNNLSQELQYVNNLFKLNILGYKLGKHLLVRNGILIHCTDLEQFEFNENSSNLENIYQNMNNSLLFHNGNLDYLDYDNTIFNLVLNKNINTTNKIVNWIDGRKKPVSGSIVNITKNNVINLL